MGTDGLAHLIDFGVAKATGRLQTTREGHLKGKLAYMSPEQLRGEPVTRRSDLYAASVVLWETLVGQRLFRASDEGATVTRVLVGEVRPPSEVARDHREAAEVQAIERLDGLVMRGLARDPAKRFATAQDMAVALERCLPPASAAEVAKWLGQAAAPALARRAAAIAAIEGGAADGSTSPRSGEGEVEAPAQPTADASSISVVSGVTAAASSGLRRRAPWLLAAAAVVAAAIPASRVVWRSSLPVRSIAAAAPSAVPSSEPAPAVSGLPAISDAPPASAAPSSTPSALPPVAAPPKRAPAVPRASDCSPPFTWDDQGKKHYKRQCL